ncbi:MAG: hypothetical protein AMJ73_01955 [candidate division Zixibacteria bacterium SM1_73]|nr:MAG: hypothetical protein AMJ73_01955 [candidate division Zixibacteria bacterium SM1_73]
MRRSDLKSSFSPGFSVIKKILALIVLGCVLVFFGLVYAGEEFDPNDPCGEHPWDESQSDPDHQPPIATKIGDMIMLPSSGFGGWIIICSPKLEQENFEKDQVQSHSSGRHQAKLFIFF